VAAAVAAAAVVGVVAAAAVVEAVAAVAGGGGFGGPGGFRGQNPNAWHGRISYTGSDNALNADSYSVTGTPVPKPRSDRNSLTASFHRHAVYSASDGGKSEAVPLLQLSETKQQFAFGDRTGDCADAGERLGDLTPGSQAEKVVAGHGLRSELRSANNGQGQQYGNTGCSARCTLSTRLTHNSDPHAPQLHPRHAFRQNEMSSPVWR
jgi:hypothetical protein